MAEGEGEALVAADAAFAEPVVIVDNADVTVTVKSRGLRQNHKYDLDDHLYVLSIKAKGDEPEQPAIASVFESLDEGITKILTQLRGHYTDFETNNFQVFLTVVGTDERFKRGINTGGFSLQTPPQIIANQALNQLEFFLQSNQEMQLHDGFEIDIKVLSMAHVTENLATGKPTHVYEGDWFAGEEQTRFLDKQKPYLLKTPMGFCYNKNAFKNKCLLTACISGYQVCIGQQEEYFSANAEKVRKKFGLEKCTQTAAIAISEQMLFLEQHFPQVFGRWLKKKPGMCPEEMIPILASHYSCQYVILSIHGKTVDVIYQYPPEFDRSLPTIYLLQRPEKEWGEDNRAVCHVDVIWNFRRFCDRFGVPCIACHRSFASKPKDYEHRCNRQRCCIGCRRPIKQENTFINRLNRGSYCNLDNKKSDFVASCPKCNYPFRSIDCAKKHKKYCFRAWMCPICKQIEFPSHRNKDLQGSHICGRQRCKTCFERVDDLRKHICRLRAATTQKYWNKVGVIAAAFKNTAAACYACFKDRKLCVNHRNMRKGEEEEVNMLTVYREAELRGDFDCFVIGDQQLGDMNDVGAAEKYDYMEEVLEPTTFQGLQRTTADYKRGKFGKDIKGPFKYRYPKVKSGQTNAIERFLMMLFSGDNEKWRNVTFLVYNERRLLNHILRALVKGGLFPSVRKDGAAVQCLTLKENNIRFVDIDAFQTFDPVRSAELLGENYRYFPVMKNRDGNYEITSYSAMDCLEFQDSAEKVVKVTLQAIADSDQDFQFAKELASYCHQNAKLLLRSATKLLKTSFALQLKLLGRIGPGFFIPLDHQYPFYHIFSYPFASASGWIFALFKLAGISTETELCAVKREREGISTRTSNGELTYVKYLQFQDDKRKIISALSPGGQQSFKAGKSLSFPDLYMPEEKLAVFYNGCAIHSHDCPVRAGKDSNFKGVPNEKVRARDQEMMENLVKDNSETIEDIDIKWECEVKQMQKDDDEFKSFLKDECSTWQPIRRLIPRCAVKAARTELFNPKYDVRDGETLHYFDMSGAFANACLRKEFPVGPYEIIVGSLLRNVKYKKYKDELQYTYTDEDGEEWPVFGLIHCSYVPPADMEIPLLCHERQSDGAMVYANCRTCANKFRQGQCQHRTWNSKRMTGVYSSSEVNLARSEGYAIVIHEIYMYKKKARLFEDFVKVIGHFKLKTAGFPPHVKSEDEKKAFCDNLNFSMKFNGELLLNPEDIVSDPIACQWFKMLPCLFSGKWASFQQFSEEITYVHSRTALVHIMNNPAKRLKDIFLCTPYVLQLTVELIKSKLRTNLHSNLVYNVFITSETRIEMYKRMRALRSAKFTILYTNTDSLCFYGDKDIPERALPVGSAYGEFKPVFHRDAKLLTWRSLGPTNYSIGYTDETGCFHQKTSLHGMSLAPALSTPNPSIDCRLFSSMLDDLYEGRKKCVATAQNRVLAVKDSFMWQKYSVKYFMFRNNSFKKRVLKRRNDNYTTLPFGFRQKAMKVK